MSLPCTPALDPVRAVHHRAAGLSDRIALGFTNCWKLPDTATLRDVILVVRDDEAHRRDVNHAFADELSGAPPAKGAIPPYPEHADDIELAA